MGRLLIIDFGGLCVKFQFVFLSEFELKSCTTQES